MENALLTVDQLATLLAVKPSRVYDNWRQPWGIPAFRVGGSLRFRRADVDAWLEGPAGAVSVSRPRLTAEEQAARKAQAELFFEWLSRLLSMEYPGDPTSVKALADARVRTGEKWHQWVRFCAWLGSTWGMYGDVIRPTRMTMAEELGLLHG